MSVVEPVSVGETAAPSQRSLFALSWLNFLLSGIYEQFAGFHSLEPLDLAAYAERTVPIDVVIGRERT